MYSLSALGAIVLSGLFVWIAAASGQNLVLNPSFETVELAPAGGIFSPSVPTNWSQAGNFGCGYEALTAGQTPVNGEDFTIAAGGAANAYPPTNGTHVLISDEGNPFVTCVIFQDVPIPASATSATLTLAAGSVFQFNGYKDTTVDVSVVTPAGGLIAHIYTRSSAAGSNDPLVDRPSVDLSAYAGQTVRIIGTTTVGGGDWSGLQMDNVRLVIEPTPNIDQQGLTGSWYEASEDGQGFEIEIYPDLISRGTGLMQGAWFTFDVAPAGGADHQRWYTFNGHAQSGAANAPVTIYQNTGGNFNAQPVTNGVAVGTGTLSFNSCTSGSLAYTFSDGSGRSGWIPMTRITPSVSCSEAAAAKAANADFALSGNWFDATISGQGFVFEVNPLSPVVFFAWYTYAPDGQGAGAAGQRWFTGQGTFTAGTHVAPLTLYETTGGIFDTPTLTTQASVAVGTATVTFASCTSAQLSFSFTGGSNAGHSGMVNLTRVGPAPAGCAVN